MGWSHRAVDLIWTSVFLPGVPTQQNESERLVVAVVFPRWIVGLLSRWPYLCNPGNGCHVPADLEESCGWSRFLTLFLGCPILVDNKWFVFEQAQQMGRLLALAHSDLCICKEMQEKKPKDRDSHRGSLGHQPVMLHVLARKGSGKLRRLNIQFQAH